MSEFFKTVKALDVISSKLPIGVETIYRWFLRSCIMKIKILLSVFYIIFLLNSNLLSNENNKSLKVGLLAPLSGPYSEIGNSLLYSLQLALEEINDEEVFIVPRDSGFNNEGKMTSAVKEMRALGVKIIIGPTNFEEFDLVKEKIKLLRWP